MANEIVVLCRILILLSTVDMAMSQSGVTIWTSTTVSKAENTTNTNPFTEGAKETESLATLSAKGGTNVPPNPANTNNGNTPKTITVGPTKTEWLTMTLFGIYELENEEEWSKYTAEFAKKYIFGPGNVYEATIDINVVKQQPVFKTRDDSCGCLECKPDVLDTEACDDQGYCSTCGDRIAYAQIGEGKTQTEACSQIAGLEFEESCGPCNPLTCNQPTTFCGCPECTVDVWAKNVCDEDGLFCSTCGERVTYLHSDGELEQDACIQVAGLEYEESCGPCNPLTCNQPTTFCGCPECTEEIWTSNACDEAGFCSTCGERINFLQMIGQTERDACIQISGNEHQDPCGQCNPLLCSPESSDPSFLSDISAKITYTETITYKTQNQLITPAYVIHAPFAEEGAQSEYLVFLQSQSNDYDDIISVSPVTVSSPPPVVNGEGGGGPSLMHKIVAALCGIYAFLFVWKESTKFDKYDAGVGEYPPGQYPPERCIEKRPAWQYPSEWSDEEIDDSEEMDDSEEIGDDSAPSRETDEDSPASLEDVLVDEDGYAPVSPIETDDSGSVELVVLRNLS